MFDVAELVAACRAALAEPEPRLAVQDVLEAAVSSPDVAAALPTDRAELTTLHTSPELTVLKVVWTPGLSIVPHDHRMWAAIGIYRGREDNTFFGHSGEAIMPRRTTELEAGEVLLLGREVVHAVHNPLSTCTGALHVYGGDFFGREMSQWDPETLEPSSEITPPAAIFEAANERLGT